MKKTLKQKQAHRTLVRLRDNEFMTHESGAGLSSFTVETRPILPLGFVVGAFFWNVRHKKKDKETAMQAFDEVLLKIANE